MTSPSSSSSAMDLRSRVLDAVRREPSAPRPVEARRRARLLAAGFALGAGVAATTQVIEWIKRAAPNASGGGRGWSVVTDGAADSKELAYVVTVEVVWLLVALVATWAGLARGRSMLGRSAFSKVAVATLTPFALVLMWLVAAAIWLETVLPRAWLEAMGDAENAGFHATCTVLSVACGLGPLLAFLALRYRQEPLSPTRTGAAFGAVAGAWGAVLHFPSCQCTSPLHIALGHILPVAVLAGVGALLGGPILGVRASSARPQRI